MASSSAEMNHASLEVMFAIMSKIALMVLTKKLVVSQIWATSSRANYTINSNFLSGAKTTCLDEEFACSSGRCLPNSMKCDGRRDCPQGEDELKCQQECLEDSFLCPEGFCISKSLTCDGRPDCSQGEDEKDCTCGEDEFRCSFGGGCIMQSKQCDGVFNCADNSDEWNCLNLGQNNQLLVK